MEGESEKVIHSRSARVKRVYEKEEMGIKMGNWVKIRENMNRSDCRKFIKVAAVTNEWDPTCSTVRRDRLGLGGMCPGKKVELVFGVLENRRGAGFRLHARLGHFTGLQDQRPAIECLQTLFAARSHTDELVLHPRL